MPEFKFDPSKSYTSEQNARNAILKVVSDKDRWMVVGVPSSARFAPLVIDSSKGYGPGYYAHRGITVIG